MYNMHPLKLWAMKFMIKKFLCIIHIDFLEFVQLLISLYRLKIRIYIIHIMCKSTKFTQYLEQTNRHVHTKMQQTYSRN